MGQEPFGDIPLFRELQRILAAGSGPVNYEIARQIATALATQGVHDPAPDPQRVRAFADAVHDSENVVSGYTRLGVDEPARTHLIGPGEWATMTLRAWAWLLERLAVRFTGEIGRVGGAEAGAQPVQAAMQQVAPLLVGAQAGVLVGHLAREALGTYDVPIPRDGDGRLFLVLPNAVEVARDYGFDLDPLIRWLALHDVARHLVYDRVAWTDRYHRSLLTGVIDAIEIDVQALEQRFVDLQTRGMEALAGDPDGSAPDAIPIVESERHRRALSRLNAFLALVEGYAVHAVRAVAPGLLGDTARIDEAVARLRAAPSEPEAMLSNLLGIAPDRELEQSGATFCAAVTELEGIHVLNRVWDAPDNVPALEEIRDPFAWIERLGD